MAWSRRNLLSALSASVVLARAGHAAAACDVSRARVGDLPSKSYACDLGQRRTVTATFLRLSDLMFDISRSTSVPDWLPAGVNGLRVLPSPTLDALDALFARYGQSVDRSFLGLNYNSAQGDEITDIPQLTDGPGGPGRRNVANASTRTLGAWNRQWSAPTFPSPSVLRDVSWLSQNDRSYRVELARFARRADFTRIENDLVVYVQLLRQRFPYFDSDADALSAFDIGNIEMLRAIDAGSVDRFVPIFAANAPGCGAFDNIGVVYDPPALFVDVAVFENTGRAPLVIDDILGEVDRRTALRPYSTARATGLEPLGQGPIQLDPGQSVLLVQRLLFRALHEQLPDVDAVGAVYGQTALPTGIVSDGQVTAFDGRSHNALILSSYLPQTCCPFLDYWCREREEWVSLGNVIGGAEGPDKARTDTVELKGWVGHIRLTEQEAETSCIQNVQVTLALTTGPEITLTPKAAHFPCLIDFLQRRDFAFDLPDGIDPADVVGTRIAITGYYAKFHSAERSKLMQDMAVTAG